MNFAQSISTNNQNEISVCDGLVTYLYVWNGTSWNVSEVFSGGSDSSMNDYGDKLVTSNQALRVVKIFTKDQNGWSELSEISSSEDNFGAKLKISGNGNTLCIQTRQDIKVYKYESNQWNLFQENFIKKKVIIRGQSLDLEIKDFDINWDGSKIVFSHEWSMPSIDDVADEDIFSSLANEDRNSLVEVWDLYRNNQYERVFDIEGKYCKISGNGERILIADTNENSIQVRERDGLRFFAQIGNKIYSRIENFGSSMSIDHYGSIISASENFNIGRVKVYVYNNKTWSSVGDPFSSSSTASSYGEIHSIFQDGSKIAIAAEPNKVEVFNLKRKVLYLKDSDDLDFGDLDWREREAYSLSSFVDNDTFDATVNVVTDILPLNLPTESDYDASQESRTYEWSVDARYLEYIDKVDHYVVADDAMSPYGSIMGNYEFVNIANINNWKKDTIIRHTSNSQFFYDGCTDKRSTYSDGRCRPIWPETEGYRNSNPTTISLENLYAKESIIEANVDSKADQSSKIRFDRSNYQSLGYEGGINYFKDNVANRFWSNLSLRMKTSEIGQVVTDTDDLNQDYIALKDLVLKNDLWRFTPSFTNFLKEKFDSNVLPYNFNPNNLLKLGQTASCGGSIPYLGYNEDGHILERELICMPAKRIINISNDYANDVDYQNYLFIFVQWSLTYIYPPNEKIMPMAIRRLYNINDKFSYRGSAYGVYDYFPFQDFGMSPIRWNKSVKQ